MGFCGLIDNSGKSKMIPKATISLKVQSLAAENDTTNSTRIQLATNLVINFIL
jgi:hypothetical protein